MNFLNNLKGDIQGGIISSIVALPQALAFGVAVGLGASSGVWGAIILCFVAGLFGGKVPLISGPTGPVAIVTASVAANFQGDLSSIFLVLFLSAIIQILISLTNAPSVVKYVPYPVISGFLNGVGTILILMQLNPLVGNKTLSNSFESVKYLILNLGSINKTALILGVLTLFIIFVIPKKISRIIPSELIALILVTFISIKMGADVDKISNISISFPSFIIPNFDFDLISKAFPYALTLAVICSSETMMTSLVADSLKCDRTNANKTLFSQGLGNLFCALTGSMTGSAATMRTVAAINSGAATRLAAFINPVILILLITICSSFVKEIPLCVLAGILIKIGLNIIDVKLLKVIKYAPKDDLIILFTVFLLTVFYNLIFAVGAGITLAALLYAKRVADKTNLTKTTYNIEPENLLLEAELTKNYKYQIRVVHIDGQFFFGSATQIVSQFDEMLGTKYLVINYESTSLLDISAVFALEDIIIRLKAQHIILMLIIKSEAVLNQLKDLNIISQIGEENVFHTEKDAVNFAKKHIKLNLK